MVFFPGLTDPYYLLFLFYRYYLVLVGKLLFQHEETVVCYGWHSLPEWLKQWKVSSQGWASVNVLPVNALGLVFETLAIKASSSLTSLLLKTSQVLYSIAEGQWLCKRNDILYLNSFQMSNFGERRRKKALSSSSIESILCYEDWTTKSCTLSLVLAKPQSTLGCNKSTLFVVPYYSIVHHQTQGVLNSFLQLQKDKAESCFQTQIQLQKTDVSEDTVLFLTKMQRNHSLQFFNPLFKYFSDVKRKKKVLKAVPKPVNLCCSY